MKELLPIFISSFVTAVAFCQPLLVSEIEIHLDPSDPEIEEWRSKKDNFYESRLLTKIIESRISETDNEWHSNSITFFEYDVNGNLTGRKELYNGYVYNFDSLFYDQNGCLTDVFEYWENPGSLLSRIRKFYTRDEACRVLEIVEYEQSWDGTLSPDQFEARFCMDF